MGMSDMLPVRFMHFALAITGAQRGMAVDTNGTVLAAVNLSDAELSAPDFTGFINIEQAVASSERPYVTNNLIPDPDDAPNTNTNFTNLRLVVIFPLDAQGAVYIDQHVNQGVLPNAEIARLMRVAEMLMTSDETDADDAKFRAVYDQLT